MKKTLTLFTVIVLLVSSTFSILSLNTANGGAIIPEFEQLPLITINKDGTITPETAKITHNGNIYNLTTDLTPQKFPLDRSYSGQYNIVIYRDNVIFDGGGHLIDVFFEEFYSTFTFYNDSGIVLDGVNNVTVRNLRVNARDYIGPYIRSNYCTFEKVNVTGGRLAIRGNFNVITDCNMGINLWGGSNNSITRNTLTDVQIYTHDKSNKVFANNIYPKTDFDSLHKYHNNASASWDNGVIGNYWNDYLTKYPNALEIGNTGIGNTSYVINPTNIDFHPLMYPISAPQINLTCTENATYTDSFPLNFTVNKPIKWAGYRIDGTDNVTVSSNTTLSGISSGVHNITVYATDVYGFEGASNTVSFIITAQTAFPELSLTVSVAVAVGILAVTVVLCLVFWKKKP